MIKLPFFIFVRSGLNTICLQISNHTVKFSLPHLFKPFGITEPFYKSGTNGVICTTKCSTIPRFSKCIVTIAAQGPNLRTIIGTINSSSNITAATFGINCIFLCSKTIFIPDFCECSIWIFINFNPIPRSIISIFAFINKETTLTDQL